MALSDKVPQSTSLNSWEYSLINNPDHHYKEFLKTPSPRKKPPNCFPQRLRGIHKENCEKQRDSISLLRTNSCPSDIKTDVNHPKNESNMSSFINSKNVNSIIDNGLQVLNDTSRKRKHLHDKWIFQRENFNEPHLQSSLKTLIEDSSKFDDKTRVQFLIGNMINGINNSIKRELADGTLRASTQIKNVILPSNKINTNKSMQSILDKKSPKKCCIANFKNKASYLYSQLLRSKIKSHTNEHTEIFTSIKTPTEGIPCTQLNSNIVHIDSSKFYAIPLGIPQLQSTPFFQHQLPHVLEIKSSEKESHSKVNDEIDRKEEIKRNLIIQKLPAVSIEPTRKKPQVNTQVVNIISNDNKNFPQNQVFHNPIEMLPHTKYNQGNYSKEGEHHFTYEALSDPVRKQENYLRDRNFHYPHNIVSHGSLNETCYNSLEEELKQKKNIEVQVTDWIEAELLSRILSELQLQQTDSTVKNNDAKEETNTEPPVAQASNSESMNGIKDRLDFPKEIHLPLEDIDNISTPALSPTQSISFLSPVTPDLSQVSESNQDKHLTHNLTSAEKIPELVENSFDMSLPVTPALSEKVNSETDYIPNIKTLSLSEECVVGSPEDLKLPNKKAVEQSYKSSELLENFDKQETAQKSFEIVSETCLTKEQENEPRSLNNKTPSEELSSQSYADLSDGDIHSIGQFLHDERSLGVSKNSLLNELVNSEEFSNLDNSEIGLSEGEIGLNNLSAINSILEGINKLESQKVEVLPTYISRNDISVGEILTSEQRCVLSDFDDDSLSLGEVITNISACKRFKFKSVENMHQNAEWRNKYKILVKTDDPNSKVLESQNIIKHFNDNVKPIPKPRQKIKKFTLPSSPNEVPINRTEKIDDHNQLIVSMEPLAINKDDGKIDCDQSDNSEKAIADDTIYDVSEISLNENL